MLEMELLCSQKVVIGFNNLVRDVSYLILNLSNTES